MQLRRNRSTRSLWDPAYVDETWINDRVNLIPRLKGWVNTYYPNTPIGITEYNWGAEAHINGATAQADVYGIFGREGLDMGARWTTPDASTPTFKAMKLFRNYDGAKHTFGNVSVAASGPNPDNVSVFAAERTADGALTVLVINKQIGVNQSVTVNLANFGAAGRAEPWQLTSANQITRLADVTVSGGAFTTSLPAQSITLFVIPGGSTPPPPGTPSFTSAVSAAPASLQPGASSTLTAQVSCTAGSLADGVVDLQVYNSSGVQVGAQSWTAQSFTAGAQKTYTYAWVAPAAAGTYTVRVAVSGPNRTPQYHLNAAAATVTVTAPPTANPTFTTGTGASPSSVTAGAASTLTATVTCTSGSLSGGVVDLEVYNSAGTQVGQKFWDAENFATGQQKTYTYAWTAPSATGTYTLKVGVFGPGWNPQYAWNNGAGTVTVTAPSTTPTFTAGAAASPVSVTAGGTSTVTATVNCTGGSLSGGVVDVEIYNGAGAQVGQKFWDAESFTAGQQKTYTYAWTAPAAAGNYTVKVGVFGAGWNPQYLWNNEAGTITVTAPSTTPTFTSSAVASPAPVGGSTTTVTAAVRCTSGSMTGGVVDVEIYNSAGTKVGQKFWTSESFATGQQKSYTYAWTAPAAPGTYSLHVGVFGPNWNPQYDWNWAAGSVTVTTATNTPPTVSLTSPASNATFTAPATVNLAASASDANGSVTKVEFFQGGVKLGEDATSPYTFTWKGAAAGTYSLTARATDNAGATTTSAAVTINVNAGPGTGTGLRGEYFNNSAFTAPATLTRTDTTVNFTWSGAPASGVAADRFSVRWTGQVEAPVSGSYTFSTLSDEGVRLWVNGQLVVDNWTAHTAVENNSAPITLAAGQKYSLKLEFYDGTGTAQARLSWAYPGTAKQVVPKARLYNP